MSTSKLAKIVTEYLKVGGESVQLVIYVLRLASEDSSWFTVDHHKEVTALLQDVVKLCVEEELQRRSIIKKRRRLKAQKEAENKRKQETEQILTGETLRMAYKFQRKSVNQKHVLVRSGPKFRSLNIFPEKLIVYVYHLQGYYNNNQILPVGSRQPGISTYFKSSAINTNAAEQLQNPQHDILKDISKRKKKSKKRKKESDKEKEYSQLEKLQTDTNAYNLHDISFSDDEMLEDCNSKNKDLNKEEFSPVQEFDLTSMDNVDLMENMRSFSEEVAAKVILESAEISDDNTEETDGHNYVRKKKKKDTEENSSETEKYSKLPENENEVRDIDKATSISVPDEDDHSSKKKRNRKLEQKDINLELELHLDLETENEELSENITQNKEKYQKKKREYRDISPDVEREQTTVKRKKKNETDKDVNGDVDHATTSVAAKHGHSRSEKRLRGDMSPEKLHIKKSDSKKPQNTDTVLKDPYDFDESSQDEQPSEMESMKRHSRKLPAHPSHEDDVTSTNSSAPKLDVHVHINAEILCDDDGPSQVNVTVSSDNQSVSKVCHLSPGKVSDSGLNYSYSFSSANEKAEHLENADEEKLDGYVSNSSRPAADRRKEDGKRRLKLLDDALKGLGEPDETSPKSDSPRNPTQKNMKSSENKEHKLHKDALDDLNETSSPEDHRTRSKVCREGLRSAGRQHALMDLISDLDDPGLPMPMTKRSNPSSNGSELNNNRQESQSKTADVAGINGSSQVQVISKKGNKYKFNKLKLGKRTKEDSDAIDVSDGSMQNSDMEITDFVHSRGKRQIDRTASLTKESRLHPGQISLQNSDHSCETDTCNCDDVSTPVYDKIKKEFDLKKSTIIKIKEEKADAGILSTKKYPLCSQYFRRESVSMLVCDTSTDLSVEDIFSDCFIQEAFSDPPVIKIEESESERWEREISRACDIPSLTNELLEFMVNKNEKYLRNIFQGKTHCRRHEDYKRSIKSRANLVWQVPLGLFKDQQVEQILQSLRDMFCRKHNKYMDYVLKVMFPEMLIKIYMTLYNVNHDEAEKKMEDALDHPDLLQM